MKTEEYLVQKGEYFRLADEDGNVAPDIYTWDGRYGPGDFGLIIRRVADGQERILFPNSIVIPAKVEEL